MQITIKAIGTKPLLLHNVDLANPLNPWARKMADLRGTPSKRRTEKWHEEMAYANFMGAFYEIPGMDGVAVPAENLRRSIIDAAKAQRLGTQVLRSLMVTVAAIPLIYDGPKTPQLMWDSGNWHLTRMIRGTGGASPTTYPIFREWAVKVPFELDETLLNIRDLTEIAQRAGRIEGLGASRKQGYGRYDALVETSLPIHPSARLSRTVRICPCPYCPRPPAAPYPESDQPSPQQHWPPRAAPDPAASALPLPDRLVPVRDCPFLAAPAPASTHPARPNLT